jgi:hypothetical protein
MKSVYQALESLIEITIEMSKKVEIGKDKISYLKEHKTIRLCGPRQSGHTTSIGMATDHFSFDKIAVAIPTCRRRSDFMSREWTIKNSHKVTMVNGTISNDFEDALRARDFDAIFFDGASFFYTDFQIEVMYIMASSQKHDSQGNGLPLVIFLQ